jgi:hypothetical protein
MTQGRPSINFRVENFRGHKKGGGGSISWSIFVTNSDEVDNASMTRAEIAYLWIF